MYDNRGFYKSLNEIGYLNALFDLVHHLGLDLD